jgi:chemotaxis protein MotB
MLMKYNFITTVGLAIGALTMTGCVSSGKHKAAVGALETQLSDQRAANEENQKNISNLEQKLLSTTKDRGSLQASLDEMKKAMDEMKERQAEQKKRLQEFSDLTRRFKRLTDAGTLSVNIVDGKMVVSLGSDVLFPAGSARLSKEGMAAIREVAQQLASIPEKRYQVEGHTDNIPISTQAFPSNWELASARALSVVKTMIEAGMPSTRVSAASYAENSPVKANDSPEGRSANRRVAIVVVPDLASLPGYEELQKMSQ